MNKKREAKENNKKEIVLKTISVCFTSIFMVLMFVFMINNFIDNKTDIVHFDFKIVVIFMLVFEGMLCLITSKCTLHGNTEKVIILLILLVLQIVVIGVSFREIGWDCGTCISLAAELEKYQTVSWPYYLAEYPNNALLICFWRDLFHISELLGLKKWMVAVGINVICIDSSIWLVCSICKKMWNSKVELCSLYLSAIILGGTFWITVPYTDTLSMPIPLLLLFLYIKITQSSRFGRKCIYAVLFGIVLLLGYMLKPTNILIVIAMCLIILIRGWRDKEKQLRMGIVICIMILMGAGMTLGIFGIRKNEIYKNVVTKEDEYNYAVDMLFYINMGLADPYGAFNMDDTNKMGEVIGKDQKYHYNMNEIKERLQKKGIDGYVSFLYNKANFVFTDGTFFFGGEGGFYSTDYFIDTSGVLRKLRDFRTYGTDEYNKWSCNLSEAMWIMLLFHMFSGALIDLTNKRKIEIESSVLIIRTAILGIIAFLLLFEARSRYLLNHLPLMIILASYGWMQLKDEYNIFLKIIKKIHLEKSLNNRIQCESDVVKEIDYDEGKSGN